MIIKPEEQELINKIAETFEIPVDEMEILIIRYGILIYNLPYEKRLELKKILDDFYDH